MKKTLAIIIAAAVLTLPVFASIKREVRIHFLTDRHNNPTAMIWTPGVEAFFSSLGYRVKKGEPFPDNDRYHTLDMSEISDPVGATVRYIDAYGFYTPDGRQRWDHTAMSDAVWGKLTRAASPPWSSECRSATPTATPASFTWLMSRPPWHLLGPSLRSSMRGK